MDGRRNFHIYSGEEKLSKKDAGVEELNLTLKHSIHKELKEGLNLADLEKTKLEKKICEDVFVAIRRLLDQLKLKDFSDSIDLNLENIHIVSREEFYNVFPENFSASNHWGEAYLIRNDKRRQEFVASLTHELAHCVSYREANIRKVEGRGVEVEHRGAGYQRNIGDEPERFLGLMEAVNEIFAMYVRSEFIKINKNLTAKEKRELVDRQSYYWIIEIVEELLDKLSADRNERDSLGVSMLRDHITGGHSFFDRAEAKLPGVTEVLAGIDTSFESALIGAEKLGLIKSVKYIKNLIEEDR